MSQTPEVLEAEMLEPGCGEILKSALDKPLASVIITTKNRRDELYDAVRSALSQSVPVEVLVVDDGSTDGTAEMIRTQFPTVRLERSESSLGYIIQRNRAARLATGDIIFSLDDDAVFTSPHTVEQTLREFSHPRVGAVAIPYVEPHKSMVVHQKPPDIHSMYVTDRFIGTAHAVRKDVFLKLRGYRDCFIHQGEEGDFSLRMLAAGWFTVLGRSDPIHHFESPKRDLRRMDFYGCRNAILFAWLNVPMPALPVHLVMTTVNCLLWSFKPQRVSVRLGGLLAGYRDAFLYKRNPVSSAAYRQFRRFMSGSILLAHVMASEKSAAI